ncbi:Importin7,8-like protein, partial [Rozella allomycis CSF55]
EGEDGFTDGPSEKLFSATSILKTLSTLAIVLDDNHSVLQQVQHELLPMIKYCIENAYIDIFEELFELTEIITTVLKNTTPDLWSLFPLMHKCIQEFGIDYICEMAPTIDNMISYGGPFVSEHPELRAMIVDFCTRIVDYQYCGENDCKAACLIMESTLLHSSSNDDIIPNFIQLVWKSFNSFKQDSTLLAMLNVLISCIYSNPILSVQFMEQSQIISLFFRKWVELAPIMSRVHDKKLSISTIMRLLALPSSQLPSMVGAYQPLMDLMLTFVDSLPEAEKHRKELEEEDEEFRNSENDDDEDYDVAEEIHSDEEDNDFKQSEPLNQEDEDEFDDDDENFLHDIEEDLYFESPLLSINSYSTFQEFINTATSTNPDLLNTFNQFQQKITNTLALCQKRLFEIEQEKIKAAKQ